MLAERVVITGHYFTSSLSAALVVPRSTGMTETDKCRPFRENQYFLQLIPTLKSVLAGTKNSRSEGFSPVAKAHLGLFGGGRGKIDKNSLGHARHPQEVRIQSRTRCDVAPNYFNGACGSRRGEGPALPHVGRSKATINL